MKERERTPCPRTDEEFLEYLDKNLHIYALQNNTTLAEAVEALTLSCKLRGEYFVSNKINRIIKLCEENPESISMNNNGCPPRLSTAIVVHSAVGDNYNDFFNAVPTTLTDKEKIEATYWFFEKTVMGDGIDLSAPLNIEVFYQYEDGTMKQYWTYDGYTIPGVDVNDIISLEQYK